jgi:hypothetical protein
MWLRRFWYLYAVLVFGSMLLALKYEHRKPKAHQPTPAPRAASHKPALNIRSVVEHGHIVEVVAETEPGSIMMINGQQAAVVFDGNEARHFVGPLPDGVSDITITVQKDDGGVNTQQIMVELH